MSDMNPTAEKRQRHVVVIRVPWNGKNAMVNINLSFNFNLFRKI